MKLHKKVKRSLVLALTAAGLSCAGAKPVKSGPHPDVRLSAWTAYWDAEAGSKDYKDVHRHLAGLSAFAAYQRKSGRPLPATKAIRRRNGAWCPRRALR